MSCVYVLYDSFELQIHRFNEKSIYAIYQRLALKMISLRIVADRYRGENRPFKYFGGVYEAYSFRWISKFTNAVAIVVSRYGADQISKYFDNL